MFTLLGTMLLASRRASWWLPLHRWGALANTAAGFLILLTTDFSMSLSRGMTTALLILVAFFGFTMFRSRRSPTAQKRRRGSDRRLLRRRHRTLRRPRGVHASRGSAVSAELVQLLNEMFSRFDLLVERHGVEKIKTIGDAHFRRRGRPRGEV